MFDRAFFESVLHAQVTQKARFSEEGSASVKLRLSNGETMTVNTIALVEDGYAVFDIYPQRGKSRPSGEEERKQGAPLFDFDRIALPYDTIIGVEITTLPQKKDQPGFQVKPDR